MKNFFKKNKIEVALIAFIILVALALRLYRINEFMTFLGDEGRDVRIVRDLITKGNLPFIGPQTSVGNMYLGPLYYYMMAPALFLSGLNPVGPAMMNALLGVLTVFLTWLIAREWFGPKAAFFSALFFALSPVAIIYSRSSWNPNPMPFFALLSVYFIYRVWQKNEIKWLPFIGFTFAAALQMHYLGLLLGPTLFIFWFLKLRNLKNGYLALKQYWLKTTVMIIVFLIMMSPLVLFDLKHQGMNFNAFKAFFTDRQTTVNLNPARSDRFIPVLIQSVSELFLARTTQLSVVALILTFVLSVIAYLKTKTRSSAIILFVWITMGFLGLGVYKQHVYIHYYGFLYPAFYLLLGFLLDYLFNQKIIFKLVAIFITVYLVYLNLVNSPLVQSPNRQLQRTEAAVDLIIKESKGEPFNFALIAKQNYDESYRYFLENKKANMLRGEDRITDQLFVICEDGDQCRPEGNSGYQVAIFGIAKVVEQWNLDHLKIYKMIHY